MLKLLAVLFAVLALLSMTTVTNAGLAYPFYPKM